LTRQAREAINAVLDEKVRPLLRLHNGDIQILSFEEGVLRVKMTGMCHNCPSAVFETEQLTAEEIKAAVSEVQSVILVSGVEEDLLEAARALMKH
jgi:Fe/S biogenesis protein NfuA